MSVAPAVNNASAKEILRLLHVHEDVLLTDFVDDFLGEGSDYETACSRFKRAIIFFLKVGVPVSDKRSGLQWPAQRQSWTGWIFDTVAGKLSVDVEKCQKCQPLLQQALDLDDKRELHARFLASAAGLASHIAEIFQQG